jgi:hypothetical protein
MPLQLSAPLEKDFTLTAIDERYGNTGEATKIRVRQATQAAHERRAQIFSEVARVIKQNDPLIDQSIEIRQRWSLEELKRLEVFMTLVGCNILNEDGNPLFRFAKRGGRTELAMSEMDFNRAWGQLPPDVAQAIYECVLEVNLDWSPLGEASLRSDLESSAVD